MNIDYHQILALTRYALLSEWRQASTRVTRGRRKSRRGWAYGTIALYLFVGLFLIRLFSSIYSGESFIAAASLIILYEALVTASNIFLSFGAGFLSPDEARTIAPMPVSSETFFFSRLAVLVIYTMIITLTLTLAPFIALFFVLDAGLVTSLLFLLACILSSITSAMAVVVLYGLLQSRLSQSALAKAIGYVQFFGSFFVAFSFVILPRLEAHLDLERLTISALPWLAYLPSYWFGSLAGLASGSANPILAVAALALLVVLAVACYVLLAKHYQAHAAELAIAQPRLAGKKPSNTRDSRVFQLYIRFARSHEARAVFMLLRAQFRYDMKFRMAMLASLPVTVLYLIVALLQGGIHDPFAGDIRSIAGTQFLYIFALIMPLVLMQSVSQSENYKAAWIFFAAPVDRAKLLLAVRNALLVSMVLPYMALLAVTFSFFMPAGHAVLHVLVLSAIAGLIFQTYLMFSAKMPFAQPRQQGRTSVATFFAIAFFGLVPLALLLAEMYFGYRMPGMFWPSFALILTLSALMEQTVRFRIRKKLDREEFEG
ncbi:MAG: hypothetical protein Q8902_07545 [Bacteroidota bacterium]|nr:hypothetical protein [Bacteroidota bacterium]MDP4241886.1 hypothetical protein [Bacteroidota bacterium]